VVNHRTFLASVGIVTALAAPAYAASDAPMPLATVAHRMGLTYAYLNFDDSVSLTGHGLAVTVRPGSPFFYVNDREEPVAGMTPTYRSGDVVVSPAFAMQLATLERQMGTVGRPHKLIVAQAPMHAMTAPAERHVTDMAIAAVAGDNDVLVSGTATPNSLVSIVLKANVSPELPTVILNRSFTVADAAGKFAVDISTAPAFYAGTTYTAEGVGVDDRTPVTASFEPHTIGSHWKALKD